MENGILLCVRACKWLVYKIIREMIRVSIKPTIAGEGGEQK